MKLKCVGYILHENKDTPKGRLEKYENVKDTEQVMSRLMVEYGRQNRIRDWYFESIKKPTFNSEEHLNRLRQNGFYGKELKTKAEWETELGITLYESGGE